MLNIQNLRQKSDQKPIEYTQIKVKIPTDQYEMVVKNQIDPTIVILEAFKEVSTALDKEHVLRSTGSPVISEVVMNKPRGEFSVEKITTADRIIAELKKFDGPLSVEELSSYLGVAPSNLYDVCKNLVASEVLVRTGVGLRGQPFKFSLASSSSEFDTMFPKGTKVSVMR